METIAVRLEIVKGSSIYRDDRVLRAGPNDLDLEAILISFGTSCAYDLGHMRVLKVTTAKRDNGFLVCVEVKP